MLFAPCESLISILSVVLSGMYDPIKERENRGPERKHHLFKMSGSGRIKVQSRSGGFHSKGKRGLSVA